MGFYHASRGEGDKNIEAIETAIYFIILRDFTTEVTQELLLVNQSFLDICYFMTRKNRYYFSITALKYIQSETLSSCLHNGMGRAYNFSILRSPHFHVLE